MPRRGQIDKSLRKDVRCATCNAEFWVYKALDKYRKTNLYFCSQSCHKVWKHGENNPNWKGGLGVFECDSCGKQIKRKKHEIDKYKSNYCSEECRVEGSKTLIHLLCECCGLEIQRPQRYVDKYNHFFCDRSCRSAWMCGENNPAWNGGSKSLKYCSAWSDKEFKKELKDRDGQQCLNPMCLKTDDKLVLHHIDYHKHNCNPNNLIAACNDCNIRANTERGWHTAWYRAIMHQRYGYVYKTQGV